MRMQSETSLAALARRVGAGLVEAELCLAAAESWTGGWIAKAATDVPGSSAWFERGFVCYSNAAKMEMLGVAASTLAAHGAVSEAVAAEMARGAVARSHAQIGVAVTGVAGPDGGSAEKPVGLVWLAWYRHDAPIATRKCHFEGDREAVRLGAALATFEGILATLH